MAEKKNKEIRRARTLLDQISEDPQEQEIYENELLSEFRYNSGMAGAREYGIQEGKKENKIEIAKKMMDEGIKLNLISKITELSIEDLEELKLKK